MVQLVPLHTLDASWKAATFQFHYGSISSPSELFLLNPIKIFQFHYGSISSLIGNNNNITNYPFQFHYGSISSL